jgi:hypothetical protein
LWIKPHRGGEPQQYTGHLFSLEIGRTESSSGAKFGDKQSFFGRDEPVMNDEILFTCLCSRPRSSRRRKAEPDSRDLKGG